MSQTAFANSNYAIRDMTGHCGGGDVTVSHESEIVWNFVKFVLAPLRDVRGESRVDVLSQLRGLLADAERSPQNARKPVEEELTIEPGFKRLKALQ